MAWFWLIFAMGCVIIEIASPMFGFVLLGGSAVVGAALAAAGYPLWLQIVAVAIAAMLSLTLLRPRILAKIAVSPGVPSRAERLIGKVGKVVEPIDPVAGTGRIIVDGHDWAATAVTAIAVGSLVVVDASDGIRLSVRSKS
mgnify:CR=1 FL=1